MKSAIVYLSLTVLLFVACGGPAVDIEQEKSKLLETDRAFAQASMENGAAEAFKMFLAEDAIQMPQGGTPLIGRNAIYESMSKSTVEYTLAWSPEKAEVALAGDMGWTWGYYNMNWVDDNGEPKISRGKYVNIWRKMDDGSWKVIVDMGN